MPTRLRAACPRLGPRRPEADPSLLAFFRIALGGVLAWELWRYVDLGFVTRHYIDVPLHFTWWPFDGLRPPPEGWLVAIFLGCAVAAGLVAVGAFFRPACAVLGAGLVYIFLLDRAYYLNHWYLACLLVGLIATMPADAAWSVDARWGERGRASVPGWTLWLLRFQIGLVYLFAGLCKVNPEWLRGQPLELWLRRSTDFPVLGRWFDLPGVAVALAVAATLFDLVVAPLMLRPSTRRFVYPVGLAFHLMNSRLFNIGMFPWLMMLATVVFFPDDTPRRVLEDLRAGVRRRSTAAGAVAMGIGAAVVPRSVSPVAVLVGIVAGGIAGYHLLGGGDRAEVRTGAAAPLRRPLVWAIAVWVVVQVALPLRPYVMRSDPAWTEEGQQFAWRLLVRSKSGNVIFHVEDPASGRTEDVDPARYLGGLQLANLGEQPEMIVQFARWLEAERRPADGHDLVVRASTSIRLNGAPPRPLVDPEVDLTAVPRPWWPPAPWILDRQGRTR